MRNSGYWWIIVVVMVLLDFYVFQAIKVVSQAASPKWKMIIYGSYWTISVAAVIMLVLIPFINYDSWSRSVRTYLFATVVGLFFAKVLAVVFFLVDDIRRLLQWTVGKVIFNNTEGEDIVGAPISRSVFLSWLGLVAGGGLFSTLVYGFSNKYNYELRKVAMKFDKLPPAFKGLKIIHISDIHAGSLTNKAAVQKGIEMILKQNADLILFTGDLVNDRALEMQTYMDVFSRLKAPMGVYSTLGNHDYGDYVTWESKEIKSANLDRVKAIHGELGWKLLMNEHVALEKDGHSIALIGIENWSAKGNFPKYGRLHQAYEGSEHHSFKILMSHDPSHWDAQVRQSFSDIDLMLSGHTHGFQFGVEVPGLKWSPVQYMYRQWAGLYEEGDQKLYVNRGFGFIGYPGRVGILPEITLIELS